MKFSSIAILLLGTCAASAQLAQKITHYDVGNTVTLKAVHDGHRP